MRRSLLVMLLLLLGGCSHLPPIQSADSSQDGRIRAVVRAPFPSGRWQLVHTINARFFSGRQATLTGVVTLSADNSSIHCVLMTLEGFVLFQAVDDGFLTIKQALGPFDRPELARGIMQDIRLMFFSPVPRSLACGIFPGDATGCRFHTIDGRIVDVTTADERRFRIRQYAPQRTVEAEEVDDRGLASRLSLTARGNASYSLSLRLLDAVALPPLRK